MSNNEDPINAPAPIGRPMFGEKKRVSQTLTISDPSAEFLNQCVKQLLTVNPKAKAGHVFDRMTAHCKRTKFNPTKENP